MRKDAVSAVRTRKDATCTLYGSCNIPVPPTRPLSVVTVTWSFYGGSLSYGVKLGVRAGGRWLLSALAHRRHLLQSSTRHRPPPTRALNWLNCGVQGWDGRMQPQKRSTHRVEGTPCKIVTSFPRTCLSRSGRISKPVVACLPGTPRDSLLYGFLVIRTTFCCRRLLPLSSNTSPKPPGHDNCG